MKEMSDLFCSKAAVGGNYNLTRDSESKELLYKNAIAKQTAVLKALKEESDADKERIEYLNGLNILLQEAIKDLKHDLGITS